eukprot:403353476
MVGQINYESPYSKRAIRKQDEEMIMSQPVPPQQKQTMKQFLNLMTNQQASISPERSRMSAQDKKYLTNQSSLSHRLSNISKVNQEPSEYQNLLEVHRDKRSQQSYQSPGMREKSSMQNLAVVHKKLVQEEGFTSQDIQTVETNMIFFKSIAEVKKRKTQQNERMKPSNLKQNVQSKLSCGLNNSKKASHRKTQSSNINSDAYLSNTQRYQSNLQKLNKDITKDQHIVEENEYSFNGSGFAPMKDNQLTVEDVDKSHQDVSNQDISNQKLDYSQTSDYQQDRPQDISQIIQEENQAQLIDEKIDQIEEQLLNNIELLQKKLQENEEKLVKPQIQDVNVIQNAENTNVQVIKVNQKKQYNQQSANAMSNQIKIQGQINHDHFLDKEEISPINQEHKVVNIQTQNVDTSIYQTELQKQQLNDQVIKNQNTYESRNASTQKQNLQKFLSPRLSQDRRLSTHSNQSFNAPLLSPTRENKHHYEEVTEAYLAKFRPEYGTIENQELQVETCLQISPDKEQKQNQHKKQKTDWRSSIVPIRQQKQLQQSSQLASLKDSIQNQEKPKQSFLNPQVDQVDEDQDLNDRVSISNTNHEESLQLSKEYDMQIKDDSINQIDPKTVNYEKFEDNLAQNMFQQSQQLQDDTIYYKNIAQQESIQIDDQLESPRQLDTEPMIQEQSFTDSYSKTSQPQMKTYSQVLSKKKSSEVQSQSSKSSISIKQSQSSSKQNVSQKSTTKSLKNQVDNDKQLNQLISQFESHQLLNQVQTNDKSQLKTTLSIHDKQKVNHKHDKKLNGSCLTCSMIAQRKEQAQNQQ